MVNFKSIAASTLVATTVLSTATPFLAEDASAAAKVAKCNKKTPKNVILMIGDGMGVSQLGAYRYYKDDTTKAGLSRLSFDNYLVGSQFTISDDPKLNITDSGAAGTALATGVKTYNGAISVDKNKKPVRSVLEAWKAAGKSTGLVATSELTHATPAVFASHQASRKEEMDIAKQMVKKIKGKTHLVDVMLGGGVDFFKQKDKDGKVKLDLVKKLKDSGYSYVTSASQLKKDKSSKVIGLFAPSAMAKDKDRPAKEPALKDMTEAAIQKLSKNKKGFFLMVEGSQVDWSGHANDLTGMMSEIQAFDKAYQSAMKFAKKDCNTLVIALADHATGGLSVGSGSDYEFHPQIVDKMKMTSEGLSFELTKDGADIEKLINDNIKIEDVTAEERAAIVDAAKAKDQQKTMFAINKIVDKRANAGWGSLVHTGEEVHVYAFGPGSEKFRGAQENTNNAKHIFSFLK